MMRVAAVMLATDPAARGAFAPAWAPLAGWPACAWAIDALATCSAIMECALVVTERRRAQAETLIATAGWQRVRVVPVPRSIPHGATTLRAQVRAACGVGATDGAELVLLHHGARPALSQALLRALLGASGADSIAAAAVPMKETVKWADNAGLVRATPPRAALWQAVTPMVLPRAALDALLARDADERAVPAAPAAPAATAEVSLARWVVEGTTYPIHLVSAGHDDVVVRRRADLARLEVLLCQ